jgi:transposase
MIDEKGKKMGGGLNGPKYIKQVLKGPLKKFLDAVKEDKGSGVLIMEDGAPSHHSKLVKQAQSKLDIKSLPHPPHSLDLNLIEPLWYVLKQRIANIPGSGNSLNNLCGAAKQA